MEIKLTKRIATALVKVIDMGGSLCDIAMQGGEVEFGIYVLDVYGITPDDVRAAWKFYNEVKRDLSNETMGDKNCEHEYVHKETDRKRQRRGRSDSRSETWIQDDIYFCQKCLEERTVKRQWSGTEYERERPDWTKVGQFRSETIW